MTEFCSLNFELDWNDSWENVKKQTIVEKRSIATKSNSIVWWNEQNKAKKNAFQLQFMKVHVRVCLICWKKYPGDSFYFVFYSK